MNSLEASSEEEPVKVIGALTLAPRDRAPLNAVKLAETWKGLMKVEVPVDSCVADCVCGPDHFPATAVEVDESEAQYGCEYVCVDGGIINNVGKKLVNALTDDGDPMRVKWQVTQVSGPLLAVPKLVDAGYDVNLHKRGGTIKNPRTGATTKVYRKRGIFVIHLWVPKPKDEECFVRPR